MGQAGRNSEGGKMTVGGEFKLLLLLFNARPNTDENEGASVVGGGRGTGEVGLLPMPPGTQL